MVGVTNNCLTTIRSLQLMPEMIRRSRDMVKTRRLNLPNLYSAPPFGVTPLEFCLDFLHQKTRVPGLSYGIVCVIEGLAILVQHRLVTDMMTASTTLA